jgi:hypothetical protein
MFVQNFDLQCQKDKQFKFKHFILGTKFPSHTPLGTAAASAATKKYNFPFWEAKCLPEQDPKNSAIIPLIP